MPGSSRASWASDTASLRERRGWAASRAVKAAMSPGRSPGLLMLGRETASSPAEVEPCLTAAPAGVARQRAADPLRGCQRPGDASYTVAFVTFSSPSALRAFPIRHRPATVLVIAGFIVFAAVLASYIFYEVTHPEIVTSYPVDLHVYRIGGLIVRHIRPYYDPHAATPLYDWPGYTSFKLKFTYPPFAAVLFAVVSVIRWPVLLKLTDLANIGLPVATLWFTYGALGYRRSWPVRLGATLLTAAAV